MSIIEAIIGREVLDSRGNLVGDDPAVGRVHHPADHQRRGLIEIVRLRTEHVGLQPPGDLEVVEVCRGDLVERRIAGKGAAVEYVRLYVADTRLPCPSPAAEVRLC